MRRKRKTSRFSDDDLKAVVRCWPDLPEHARRTMVDLARSYWAASAGSVFPTPAGAGWADVTIVLLTPNDAQITVGAITRVFSFEQMGLLNARRSRSVKSEGKMLRVYAENPEAGSYFRLPFRKNLKIYIAAFRKWLQEFFGIPGDPLKPFESAQWLPRFKISAKYH